MVKIKKINKGLWCFFALAVTPSFILGKIYIVCSAALLDVQYEQRKYEYIRSMQTVKKYGYTPYIIESCKKVGPTFFDQLSDKVFYSQANDPRLNNKGINEARTMLEGFDFFNFQPDDMIIKLTARYFFESDFFIKLVENNPDVDAFIQVQQNGNVTTGCFAVRYKYFRDMFEHLDFDTMEKEMICVETEVAHYVKKMEAHGLKTIHIDKMYVSARLNTSQYILHY